jgi:UDP-3-O-[3-hydroxymyristoyl] N-acetylglucosamine deacetylase / 3-hydroxyacyl-[acyl-carrier-protein] dehydratase
MAALAGLGIDNIIIEIDNEEMPGMDGSSQNFVEVLLKAGINEQDKLRRYYVVKEPVYVEEEESYLVALPSPEFKISYTLDYRHPFLRSQYMSVTIDDSFFQKEIAAARTFCLQEEADNLQLQGLGCGANYDNTLVVGPKGVVNNELRFPDEFVRHKILDLIGDLYMLGQPLKAHIIAVRSGHAMNLKLLRKIVQQKERLTIGGIASSCDVQGSGPLDINTIMEILPHREPFLFVDRILHLEHGVKAVGIKNVTINDYFFRGHFPGRPVMPGVLMVEAMAQVGGVMMLAAQENRGKLAFFMAANNIKFRKTVVPGDQLVFEVLAGKIKSKTGQVFAKAYVDGKVVCEGELLFALADY